MLWPSRALASARSRPQAITLAIIRSLRRDLVADGHPGVHPDAGAAGQRQVLDPTGGRGEALLRVLGGEPGLDGVPAPERRLGSDVGRPPAQGHVQLQLDDVDAGGRLGDRVLDL